MADAKHTPTPWEVVALNGFGPFAIRMPTPAGSKQPTYYGVGQIGSQEDARLIAAAPDLLAAAQEARDILRKDGVSGWGAAKDILGAAIAKATA